MARVFTEGFEATGYDNSWAETIVSGTLDEDAAVSEAGSPSGWGTKCLKVISDGGDCRADHDLPSAVNDSWLRVEVVVTAESLANGNLANILIVNDSSFGAVYTLDLKQVAGVLRFSLSCYHDGNYNGYDSLTALSLNTRYRVEVKWDSANDVWAWRIDDVDQPNNVDSTSPVTSEGTLTSTHRTNIDKLRVGVWQHRTACTYYVDNIAIDDADWVGAELPDLDGTLSETQAGNTLSASGGLLIDGQLDVSQAGNTLSAFGGLVIEGTLSAAQAGNTLSAVGALTAGGGVSTRAISTRAISTRAIATRSI